VVHSGLSLAKIYTRFLEEDDSVEDQQETIFAPNLFKGKTAIITGGGTGIGFSIARVLGNLGAHVILTSRTEETLQQAAASLRSEKINTDYFPANIRNDNEVQALFEKVTSRWGTCDFLINNAGGQFAAPALDISANGFRAVVDLNLQGTWQMSAAFAHMLTKQETPGKIVNIILCLKSGIPGMVHAGAARAGVVNMTKTLAYEWGPYGILVNAIAPGTIQTSGLSQYDEAELLKNINRLPIQRMGTAHEVAEAVAYILSPAGNYINGTTLEIDGGEHLIGAATQQ